jgi:ABC-type amino acid transport substrate-binding protein
VIDVPVMVFTIDKVDENFIVEGWESLRDYKIAILRGINHFTQKEEKLGLQVSKVPTTQSAFGMLIAGRVDVVVMVGFNGQAAMNELNQRYNGNKSWTPIKMLPTPVSRINIYQYLYKKYAVLVPQLEKVLCKMVEDGSRDKFFEDARRTQRESFK